MKFELDSATGMIQWLNSLKISGYSSCPYIQAGQKHRLTNQGKINLVLIEVQTGQYLGEDDIVRFHDVYGRVEAQSAV